MAVLDEKTIRGLIDPMQALEAVRHAFVLSARGQATLPPPMGFEVGPEQGEVHVKAGYLHGRQHYSIKIASGFYGNSRRGLPTCNGMVNVFDASTGELRAVLLDNGYLTQLRTGSAGALAADLMARPDARHVAIIGCGAQARFQLEALRLVRSIEHVSVYARRASSAKEYVTEVRERWDLEGDVADSVEQALDGADIVVTTTPAREAILQAQWLRPGMHITAMGSDGPGKRELAPQVLKRADRIVADRREQCLSNGELQQLGAVGLDATAIHADLGELAAGLKAGRGHQDEITLADLTGVGIQDAAVADYVVTQALRHGLLG